jgi:FMN phosphatase YigB (HAD superfamily)
VESLMKDIGLIVLDFDGTIYKFTPEFEQHCNEVAAETVMELCKQLGMPMTRGEALNITNYSYRNFGSSMAVVQKEYGLSATDWHDLYHNQLDHDYVTIEPGTAALLQASPVPLAVLSHSSRAWVVLAMKKFGLDGIIPPERIFGFEDADFNSKQESDKSYRIVLEKTGFQAGEAMMVEDSLLNLFPASRLGMKTVYITHGRAFDPGGHHYVNYTFENLGAFFTAFIGAYPGQQAHAISSPSHSLTPRRDFPRAAQ